ncbi:MAG: 1-deoxy-D-xylulose-5-phosphate reductoisomerase [Bacteroidota bacterium]|nr:1-deoxy-D-xylulose-5-phosphate reductoisomerase [Bacteroidota bacterium]
MGKRDGAVKTLAIFGSTGSIGTSALDVVRAHPDSFRVRYLAAHRSVETLERQVHEFRPQAVALADPAAADILRGRLGKTVEVHGGIEGLVELAGRGDYEIMLSALVGFAGMLPTAAAVRAGHDVALANKETLVVAGEAITALRARAGGRIIPVDSEHCAVMQCLEGESRDSVSRIILTASGGPFRGRDAASLARATREEALAHPNWRMGRKITIDSATLMNKGLEVIEAHWLFGIPGSRIGVLIHPQSIVHSLVEFHDGSVKAQLGVPDMKLPILYALSYPERLATEWPKLDLAQAGSLTFEEPDLATFRCLPLAYRALAEGGTAPAVLNAANEIAVQAFLDGRIGFADIADVIEGALDAHPTRPAGNLEDIVDTDREVRVWAARRVSSPPRINTNVIHP